MDVLWKLSIPCEIPNQELELPPYRLVAAPWLYMLKPGTAERLTRFVEARGTLVLTFLTGWVNETDLCFEGGFPGPLRALAGIWAEEMDALWKRQPNRAIPMENNDLQLKGEYNIDSICELIHDEGSEVLATYGDDWYRGRPVLTRHHFGKAEVYYVDTKTDQRFHDDLMLALVKRIGISPVVEGLPDGVNAQLRTDGQREEYFRDSPKMKCCGSRPNWFKLKFLPGGPGAGRHLLYMTETNRSPGLGYNPASVR